MKEIERMAKEKRCTPSQLALAWVLAQGDDIVPIPGTKRIKYLEDNGSATRVKLTPDDMKRIDAMLPPGAASGTRYPQAGMAGVNL